MHLEGTPSDDLPIVLGTGQETGQFVYISLSMREPAGRDAEYIAWHSLDHRPEQHRLPQLRQSLRVVATPACRQARAANAVPFDGIDHIMTYLFSAEDGMPGFYELGHELDNAGRMPLRLPLVGFVTGDLAGKVAAPRAVAGADVIPWRPSLGIYLIIEQGRSSAADLVQVPGVAGVWWYHLNAVSRDDLGEVGDLQVTYCYLDADPVEVAGHMTQVMQDRWQSGAVKGLFASPFYTIVPFAWDHHLP
ncbi:MAG: hypothetical protein RLZZ136_170 [Pseudomonadota bacterium]|jgi:hypothetical protein